MRKRHVLLAAPLLALSLTACEGPSCEALNKTHPPTEAMQEVADTVIDGQPVEVESERENNNGKTECVVQGDRWVDATDDAA